MPDERAQADAVLDAALPSIVDGLEPRQVHALELMLQGHSQAKIASKLGVARCTIYAWRHQEDFDRALRWLSAWSIGQVSRRLYTLHTKMLDRLEEILDQGRDEEGKKEHPVGVQLQALKILQQACNNATKVQLAADMQDVKEGLKDLKDAALRIADMDQRELEGHISRLLGQGSE